MSTIFAHRGLPNIAPENTLSSFIKVGETHGLNWIEIDVAITKDNELIVIHDDFLDRTTNMTGEVSNSYYEDIKKASAGQWFSNQYTKEPVPTFKQLAKVINEYNLNVNIELKGVTGNNSFHQSKALITLLSKEITLLNDNIQILISSFNFTLLKLSQASLPDIERAALFEEHSFYPDWQSIVDYLDIKIIHLEDKKLTREKVSYIINQGYKLNIWTVNDIARANELFNWGVNGIFTDSADKLAHLNNKGMVNEYVD